MSQRNSLVGVKASSRSKRGVSPRRLRERRNPALEGLEPRQLMAVGITPDVYVALEGNPLTVAAPGVVGNDTSTTNSAITVTNFTQPTDGTLTLNADGSFVYTPLTGYTGPDQFTYTATDARGASGTATVQLQVNATTQEASVFAGTRLASGSTTQGTLLNTVLGGLVGANLNLTAADYTGLAGTSINGGQLAQALGAELNVTPGQALTTNATLAQVFTAAASVAQADGDAAQATALNSLAASVSGVTAPVQLGNLIQANTGDGSLAGSSLNALDLVNGTAQLFNFSNVATTPTPITVSGAALGLPGVVGSAAISAQVVEPPILITGPTGTQFHSAAIRLRTDLNLNENLDATALTTALAAPLRAVLGPLATPTVTATLNGLSVYTEIAEGQGTISAINALATAVTLQATPGLADVYVGNIADNIFFDRTRVINPATDVTPGTVGTLNVAATVLGTSVLNQSAGIQVRSVAQGDAPTASTEVFNAPFPQSQTVSTDAAFLTNLVNSLTNNLAVTTSGSLGAVLDPLVNTTILPALRPVVTNAVTPLLAPVLTEVVQPALQQLGTGLGQLDLTVNAVNAVAAPAANADFATTPEGQAVVVPVLANDAAVPGQTLTITAISVPAHGTAQLNPDGTITYTPTAGYFGPDTFTYTVTDPDGQTSTATVTARVLPLAPVAAPDTYAANQGTPLTVGGPGVLGNDTDPDGLPLTAIIAANPTRGTVTLNPDGSFTYTPTAGSYGPDTFTYQASNGTTLSDPVAVTVNVAPTLPTTNPDTYTVIAGTTLTAPGASGLLINDTDPNGLPLAASVAAGPAHGTLTLNADGSLIYTPTAGYVGPDSFTYRASDAAASGGAATVTINVVAATPVANPDAYTATSGTPLVVPASTGVLANDTDPNGLPLAATVATAPLHGTLTLNGDGSLVYTPTAGYVGPDSFTYTASDGTTRSAPATVNLSVNAAATGTPAQPPAVVTTFPVTGTVGVPIVAAPIVSYTDGNGSTPPGSYTATINWGDGTNASTGTVTEANGVYLVSGDHTYAADGSYPIAVTVAGPNGALSAGSTATIAPAVGATPNAATATASLSGTVFTDTNGDGILEAGEAGVAGATIVLAGTSTAGQPVYQTTTTASNGTYRFSSLPAGTYAIAEVLANGTARTMVAAAAVAGQASVGTAGGVGASRLVTGIVLPDGTAGTGYNFAEAANSSIAGTVYLDYNKNGRDDANEYGIANVVLTLTGTSAGGQAVSMTATTDSSGHYEFAGLPTGTYSIQVTSPTSIFKRGRVTPGTDGGTAQAGAIAGINFTAAAGATGYDFAELLRPGCRLTSPAFRTLLRVGPTAALPSTFRTINLSSTGPIATYLPTLAARARGGATAAAVAAHRVKAAVAHATPAHHAVKVQHAKPTPKAHAAAHRAR